MSEIFVLDTNVLLDNPNCIFNFENSTVVIHGTVLQAIFKLEYLEKFSENISKFNKILDGFRKQGDLLKGVTVGKGVCVKILFSKNTSKLEDAYIIRPEEETLLVFTKELIDSGNKVTLVTLDAGTRVRAGLLGVNAEVPHHKVNSKTTYFGVKVVEVGQGEMDEFYKVGKIKTEKEFPENMFAVISHGKYRATTRNMNGELVKLYNYKKGERVWGVESRNKEQEMALELLLDPTVNLVTLTGTSGTGKTLLALATALAMTEDDKRYNKVLISRATVPVGEDIGYLPGEKDEKLRPWLGSFYDNLECLFNCKGDVRELDRILEGLGSIEIEAVTYMRGRSLPDRFIIIDEAQNLTRQEVKTILTRVGERSKVVLLGDIDQIDNPKLDHENNGLTHVIENMKGYGIVGHVHLTECERSELSKISANVL